MRNLLRFATALAFLTLPLASLHSQADPVVVQALDFESSALGSWTPPTGWQPSGSPTLTVVSDGATGKALQISGRANTWDTLALAAGTLEPGVEYTFSARMRLAEGADAPGRFTVDEGDGSHYTPVGVATVSTSGWTTLSGTYTLPGTAVPASAKVSFEAGPWDGSTKPSFLIDDIRFTRPGDELAGQVSVLTSDFESAAAPWVARGATIALTGAAAHGGSSALAITGRTANWQGAELPVDTLLQAGITYTISGWVRLVSGQTATNAKLSMQVNGATTTYTQIASVAVTDGSWVRLKGTYTLTEALPAGSVLYVEADGATTELYLDDVLITKPADTYVPPGPPLATGKAKFLGCAYGPDSVLNFAKYFNQVVPGNAGKWGSVEATRGVYNWTEYDAAYRLAKANGFKFRHHIMVWGSQQPAWISTLPTAEKLQAIKDWFNAVATHQVDGEVINPDWIEVVNEPLHAPPNGETIAFSTDKAANYADALGGAGASGWEWILQSFRLARQYFPGKKLVLNEYGILNDANAMARYVQIINLLKAENLVDVVAVQAHSFEIKDYPTTTLATNLATLAATGLPIMITEMDIDDSVAKPQLADYQRIFPLFWEHPSVIGVTLWGYRPGMWRPDANLVLSSGVEKPAMLWLREYVGNNLPVVAADQAFFVGPTATNGSTIGIVQATDADAGAVLQDWSITGGTAASAFSIGATTGALTLTDAAALNFATTPSYTLVVKVGDGIGHSEPRTITVARDGTPAFSTQPATTTTATVGGDVSFSAQATSPDPAKTVTYQWQYGTDGTTFADLAGATATTLVLDDVPLTATGYYRVVATNAVGATPSTVARLDVVPAQIAAVAPDGYAAAVTGGAGTGSQTVNVVTAADFQAAATATGPRVINVIGSLEVGTINVASNKTIQGADADAALIGSLRVGPGVSNVVIRGLSLSNPAGDAVAIAGASNVFITRCTFLDSSDHQLKITNGADLVTVSWCEFAASSAALAHRYSVLVGAAGAETKVLRVTFHHNQWTAHLDQRMPLATYGQVHFYNNLVTATGNTAGTVADNQTVLLAERNVYEGVNNPLTKQSTNAALAAARIRTIENVYTACTGTAPDAGADVLFSPLYSYFMHPAAEAATAVAAGAGNLAGVSYTETTHGTAAITGPTAAVNPGATLSLTATTAGVTATGYQWRLNNTPIAGATSATYSVAMDSTRAGAYTVVVAQASGVVVSTPWVVTLGTGGGNTGGGDTGGGNTGGGSSGGGGGGGGAPSLWFFALLAAAGALRLRRRG